MASGVGAGLAVALPVAVFWLWLHKQKFTKGSEANSPTSYAAKVHARAQALPKVRRRGQRGPAANASVNNSVKQQKYADHEDTQDATAVDNAQRSSADQHADEALLDAAEIEAYDEDDVERLQDATVNQRQLLEMLQQMGIRIQAGADGTMRLDPADPMLHPDDDEDLYSPGDYDDEDGPYGSEELYGSTEDDSREAEGGYYLPRNGRDDFGVGADMMLDDMFVPDFPDPDEAFYEGGAPDWLDSEDDEDSIELLDHGLHNHLTADYSGHGNSLRRPSLPPHAPAFDRPSVVELDDGEGGDSDRYDADGDMPLDGDEDEDPEVAAEQLRELLQRAMRAGPQR